MTSYASTNGLEDPFPTSVTQEDQKPAAIDKKRSPHLMDSSQTDLMMRAGLMPPPLKKTRFQDCGATENVFQDNYDLYPANGTTNSVSGETQAFLDIVSSQAALGSMFATTSGSFASLGPHECFEKNNNDPSTTAGLNSFSVQTYNVSCDLSPTPVQPIELDHIDKAIVDLFCYNKITEIDTEDSETTVRMDACLESEESKRFLGEAASFVIQVQDSHERVLKRYGLWANSMNAPVPALVSPKDMIYMAQRLMAMQELFRLRSKPALVDIAYHYTKSDYMDSIQSIGLLTKAERDLAGIKSKSNGALLGDGIYTYVDPLKYGRRRTFGDTGLMVARLRGIEKFFECDDISRDKKLGRPFDYEQDNEEEGDTIVSSRGSYTGCAVLKQSAQCLCLVEFPREMIGSQICGGKWASVALTTHAETQALHASGTDVIEALHMDLQKCIDLFFNGGTAMSVPKFPAVPSPQRRLPWHNAPPPPAAPACTTPFLTPLDLGILKGQFNDPSTTEQHKKQKKRFLIFVKVLMRYLECKDPCLHARIKIVVQECAERNLRKEPGYESVTFSMRKKLREVVNDQYWNRAEMYLEHFLKERAQGGSKSAMMLQSTSSSSSTTLRPSASRQPIGSIPCSGPQDGSQQQPKQGNSSPGVTFAEHTPKSVIFDTICYEAPETLHDSTDTARFLDPGPHFPLGEGDECPICLLILRSTQNAAKLKACGHTFCYSCIETSLQYSRTCPVCREFIDEPQGKMPSGSMSVRRIQRICEGCPQSIQIDYRMEGGIQKTYHANPGVSFPSSRRTAYLPDTDQGCALLKRLKFAFKCGLTFSVGTSLTTLRQNVITWSSIHHKTRLNGGVHGFPDPNYFQNANEELDALGVPPAADLVD